ncbi:hypothetical protein J4404_02770 [Candidatus Woesearchaeota archaeon]|nr:hypothetical protein [Candidatus Woesearchaeota archaeon]
MQNILYVAILVAAFPVGYLLAWLARDELVSWKKWYILLAVISVVLTIPVAFISALSLVKLPVVLTLFFIAIISLMAVWKSHDKKWTKGYGVKEKLR